MSKTEEMQAKMQNSIEEITGIKVNVIIHDIKSQNLDKHNQKIAFVKEKYSLSHGFANLLALKSKERKDTSPSDIIADQFRGKENLLSIYKVVSSFINTLENVEIIPKKAYVSVTSKKQFAIIQPSTKIRLDIGLKFSKSTLVDIEESGSFNSMVSHRIRLESLEEFNDIVKQHLKRAYKESL